MLREQQGAWIELQRLTATAQTNGDELGASVALDAGRIAAGMPGFDDDRGATCVFDPFAHAFALDADFVTTGHDKLVADACGGDPGAPVLLVVTSAGATPLLLPLASGAFDAAGHWFHQVIAPSSVLGLDVGFQAFTLTPSGAIGSSSPQTVSF